jgi:hypothetical protein
MTVEKIDVSRGFTQEIGELYDGVDNLGISYTRLENILLLTYSYYDINQLLLVKDTQCVAKLLNESYDETPFSIVGQQNGKQHIISGLAQLINSNSITFKYTGGSNSVRGIIVNEWQACLFDKKSGTTSRLTVSYSSK